MSAPADGAASDRRPPDLIVIPARFGSTRLPGKPLVTIAGRTLLERVVDVGRRAIALAGGAELVVATDDRRIADHAQALGCEAVMTDAAIASGSGRAHAAALVRERAPGIVVNLQGDAPFVPPAVVARLVEALRCSTAGVATPVVRLDWEALDALRAHKAGSPFSGTTCARLADGHAAWFSKTILPAIRDEATLRGRDPLSPIYRHLGVYAYRRDALARFEALPPGIYEAIEGLEQLRFLENGIDVTTVEVPAPRHPMSGIDSARDVALAEELIARLGDPFGA
ncbi:3-deoxy-manno-octulosonate cytidylyltransferase [uncultured Sphingomonas sp.]|uniref:3-deoxy-manno-octulosonate cytidylyltransferase n=1 Tax=uncultured Sphingomonas sp. TaxID=158754 RepID=UPI0035CA7BD5